MNPFLKHSLMAGGLYFIVANPYTYDLTEAIFGKLFNVTDINGRPTQAGTALHGVVFGLLTYLLMKMAIKRKEKQFEQKVDNLFASKE
jgi:hypothetical protein